MYRGCRWGCGAEGGEVIGDWRDERRGRRKVEG